MKLYEIEKGIEECIDIETGEIIDIEKLEELQMAKDAKITNVLKWIKNLSADAEAYQQEKMKFAQLQKAAENKRDSLKEWVKFVLNGVNFESEDRTVRASYRKSQSVEVSNLMDLMNYDDSDRYLKYSDPEPRKKEIAEALKNGIEIPGCSLSENISIIIK